MLAVSWLNTVKLSKPAVYVVSQVKRQHATLALDVDDPINEELLKEAPVLQSTDRRVA